MKRNKGETSAYEYIGYTFNKLTIKSVSHFDKNRDICVVCKCECGTEKTLQLTRVKRGIIKSCGCVQKQYASEQINRILPELKPKGTAGLSKLFWVYKERAKRKNFPFELTKEEFKCETSKNCYYCGAEPNSKMKIGDKKVPKKVRENAEYIYNGLDRVDNYRGYEKDNIVTCCAKCNKMKYTYSKKDFLSQIEKIYKHSIKNKTKKNGKTQRL